MGELAASISSCEGSPLQRRLMMDTECIGQEFVTLLRTPIVSTHNLPDSVYAVSSYEDVDHEAYRARIDNYFTLIQSCLRMTSRPCKRRQSMAPEYLIKGIIIKKRCDPPYDNQYVTMVTVTTSHDDVT